MGSFEFYLKFAEYFKNFKILFNSVDLKIDKNTLRHHANKIMQDLIFKFEPVLLIPFKVFVFSNQQKKYSNQT